MSWIFCMAECLAWLLVILVIAALIFAAWRLNCLSVISNVRRLIALANWPANASTEGICS